MKDLLILESSFDHRGCSNGILVTGLVFKESEATCKSMLGLSNALNTTYSIFAHITQRSIYFQGSYTFKFEHFLSIFKVHFQVFQHITAVENDISIYSTHCINIIPIFHVFITLTSDVIVL